MREENYSQETELYPLSRRIQMKLSPPHAIEPAYRSYCNINGLQLMIEVMPLSCTDHTGSLGDQGCVIACTFQPYIASGVLEC